MRALHPTQTYWLRKFLHKDKNPRCEFESENLRSKIR